MKLADWTGTIRNEETGETIEGVRFGDLSDRQKILCLAHTLGLEAPSPPHNSHSAPVPCVFLGERRLLFVDQDIRGIVDYASKPRPGWAGEDE